MLTSSQIDRKQWQEAMAAGRDRFIWRQMFYVLVFVLISMPILDLLAFKTNPVSTQNVVIDLILLPVFLLGDEGKRNGLYWKAAEGQPESPVGPLIAFATGEGYGGQHGDQPFHGYSDPISVG